MTNHPNRANLVLCRSDRGDGGWSLHPPHTSDEEIATGDAAMLVSGDAEWDGTEWSRPNVEDYAEARRVMAGWS